MVDLFPNQKCHEYKDEVSLSVVYKYCMVLSGYQNFQKEDLFALF